VGDNSDGVVTIDSVMHGAEGVTAVYYLPGPRPAIIETAPTTSLPSVLAGLSAAGVTDLDWIVLTHIHLDHAGAAGHLAQRFPRARVVVRAEGAPHLVDPSRLWASAARLYPDMDALWGPMLPIAADRIDAVSSDGVVADLGDGRRLEAIYTPGHARHHMALFEPESGDLFTGDAAGVFLEEVGSVHPATPPPEFDLGASLESLRRMEALGARRAFPTHFGRSVLSPAELFAGAGESLRRAVSLAEEVVASGGGAPEIAGRLREDELAALPRLSEDADLARRLGETTSYELNAAGIARYLRKREAG
jgi:glyoxylase-like metal-dependent hydrolase (beta-lactamase superfamily II)